MCQRRKHEAKVKRPHWIVFVVAYFGLMEMIYG